MPRQPVELTLVSELNGTPAELWQWAMSLAGINKEFAPIGRMTAPRGLTDITQADVTLGEPLFTSWVLLFGLIPIDRSKLTLIELEPGHRLLEESPMLSMKLWRHERIVEPTADGCRLTDNLTFLPKLPGPIVPWFIRTLFNNRHRALRAAWR